MMDALVNIAVYVGIVVCSALFWKVLVDFALKVLGV
jgi:nitrogen fixation-related uncharacterized protein